jgi:hypothetical protein
VRLMALAESLSGNDAVEEYVQREIQRGELAIGDPPPIPDLTAIRELLLNESVVWEREAGIGGGDEANARRGAQMRMARALVAGALAKSRANDPSAWEDLHAVWKVARTAEAHPQMMFQTAALTMARMINAVAWKMPLPAPAWFAELQERDSLRPLLESFHYQSASYWDSGMRLFPTKPLADSVDHDRRIAEWLVRETRCEVDPPMNQLGTDLRSVWRRAFRYRAEREATANALRLREVRPIESRSRCTDGGWTFDGTTLRFSREISAASPDVAMPLVLQISL